jgi:sulfite reductase alpha subunit-like flavoprotein
MRLLIGAADEAMGLEDQVEPWLAGLWTAFAKSSGTGDGAETASSSDDEGAATAKNEGNDEIATDAAAVPRYLQESVVSYAAMFGPFTVPTETPEDVPRFQSSLYSARFLDSADDVAVPTPTHAEEEYSATHPFLATVRSAKYLTKPHSERKVLYMDLDITGSKITFTPGDSIGIKCPNRADDVDALLKRLELDGEALLCVEPATPASGARRAVATKSSTSDRFSSPCSVRDVFSKYVDLLSSPKKAALRALATYCSDEEEKARMLVLSSKSGADKYKVRHFLADICLA